jgi:S1-C subfamily serine protease
MMRQWAGSVCPLPAGGQQVAAGPEDNRFQALGRGGSGVIVNSQGYVLTNHHVIHGARNITVKLSSGQITKEYPAELIDEAPEVDFAILKIVANGEVFTPAPIGNSSQVSVGDEVLAIGSPFGLQQTVTFGIVSNTRRTLTVGNKTFTNFIQTDAPINPGSSGGPLINVNGEVIGITTAIYSPTQAFSGIGFASPIDPAKAAFPEFIDVTTNAAGAFRKNIPNWARGPALKQAAQIQRGQGAYPWCPPGGPVGRMRQAASSSNRPWLGVRVCAVNKRTREFLGLPMGYGVLVMEVYDNSPSKAAGLQRGDVIYRADNQSVKDEVMLEALLRRKKVGDKLKLTIYRDGKKLSLSVNLSAALWPRTAETILQAQAVATTAQPPAPFDPEAVQPPGLTGVLQGSEVGAGEIEAMGMGVEELVPELALAYGVPKGVKGLIVAESATQAAAAGVLAGDVIQAINGQRVETIVDFIKVMNKASLKEGVYLDVYRQGQRFNLRIKG